MRKIATYLAGGAVAIVAALAAAQPANALPAASGSMTLQAVIGGKFTVDTGDITSTTSLVHEPSLLVQDVSDNGNLKSAITPGDHVTLNPTTLPVPSSFPTGTFVAITPFTITIDGIEFTFDSVIMHKDIVPTSAVSDGSFDEQFDGTLTNGGGFFVTGEAVRFSQGCTQAGPGALIGCANSSVLVEVGPPGGNNVPEPASLTLLGASLLGFGLLWRRRTL